MIRKYSELTKIGAGLYNLKGLADLFSEVYGNCIWDFVQEGNKEFGKIGEMLNNKITLLIKEDQLEYLSQKCLKTFLAKFGECEKVKDLYKNKNIKIFKDSKQEKIFKNFGIKFITYITYSNMSFSMKNTTIKDFIPFIKIPVPEQILTCSANFQEKFKNKEDVQFFVKSTMEHELRHGVDFIFNKLNIEYMVPGSTDPEYRIHTPSKEEYYNSPTELKSYAGDVAKIIVRELNANPNKKEKDIFLEVLKNANSFLNLKQENKNTFLTRVYNEVQKLKEIGFVK